MHWEKGWRGLPEEIVLCWCSSLESSECSDVLAGVLLQVLLRVRKRFSGVAELQS